MIRIILVLAGIVASEEYPPCTSIINGRGQYSPNSECCINSFGEKKCLGKSDLDLDSIRSARAFPESLKGIALVNMEGAGVYKIEAWDYRDTVSLGREFGITLRDSISRRMAYNNCIVTRSNPPELKCENYYTPEKFALRNLEAAERKKRETQARIARAAKNAAKAVKNAEIESNRAALANQQRINEMKRKGWNEKTISAIKEKEVFIGMTREQARESWGEPSDINRTINASGTSEQWVYGSRSYLYFTNEILTAIQN